MTTSITGNETGAVTLSGTVNDINAVLKTLTYQSASVVTDTITANVTDSGNSGSGGTLSTSKAIAVTVIAPPASTPTISQQPQSKTVHPGETATFSVTASGTSIAYQWQLSKDGGSTWTDISGATGSNYTTDAAVKGDDGNQYRCYVYDSADNTSVTSEKASLTVLYPILKMAGVAPANGATGVDVKPQLTMTFNEDIHAVAGKNISIVDASGTSIPIDVTSSNVSISGSTVTVTLPQNLEYTTKYHVLIDVGAFTDDNGTAYEGITDAAAWRFTTEAAPAVKIAPPVAGSGSALSFDGSNYVDLGSNSSLTLGSNFTEEVWIYPTETDNEYHGILGNDGNGTSTRAPGIWVYDTNKIHVGFGDGTTWNSFADPDAVLTPNAWNHVESVYDGSTLYLYVNGILKYQQTLNKTPCDTPVEFIGKVDNNFKGQLDEVKLWSTARTQDEIRSDMYSRPASGTTGLAGYWNFDENSLSTAVDSSGNRNNGMLTNMDASSYRIGSGAWQNRVTAENTPITIDAGHSRYGSSIALAQSTAPTDGTLAFDDTAGTATYTPNSGYHGADTFTYTVTENGLSKSYTVNMTVVQQPDITGPSNQTVTVGNTATFTAGASVSDGGTLSYQWQKNISGTWTDISGATSEDYTTDSLAMSDSGGQYRCLATNTIGFTTAVTTSDAATLTVQKQTPSLTTPTASPVSSQTYPGDVTFSSTLSNYYGTLSGQKIDFYNGTDKIGTGTINDASGTASFTWTKPNANAGYSITAQFASDTNNASVTSSALTYGVNKGTQSALTITDPGSKTYGDGAFSLTVNDGTGTGALHFSSDNTGVLTVDESTGNVTIVGAGSATISVYKAGDGNYSQSNTATLTITVAKKALNPVITPQDKDYDRTASATVSSISYTDRVGSDDVSISGGSIVFDTVTAGTNKTVIATGYSLAGAQKSNYTLGTVTVNTANIKQKALTVTGTTVNSKSYDGTTAADFSGTPALSGVITGDSVALNGGTPTFVSKNVGNGITVNFSSFGISGSDDGNYTLTQPTSTTANITPAILTVSVNPISIEKGQSINDHINVNVTGFVGGESSSITGFTAPTATTAYSDNTTLVSGKSITVIFSNGEPTGNYQFDESNTTTTLTISSVAVGSGDYTVTGTAGSWSENLNPSAWSNSVLTVSPTGNYDQISADGSNWKSSLNISDEAKNGTFSFCLKASDGTTSNSKAIYYNLDKTTPATPTISITPNPVKRILQVISFGLFFNNTMDVTFFSTDNLSNIKNYEYQLVSDGGSLVNTDSAWTSCDGTFHIDPQFKGTIYARAVDNAGNKSDAAFSDKFVTDINMPSAPVGINETVDDSPYDGSTWTSGNVKLVISGSSAYSGIDYYEYSMDNGSTWIKTEGQSLVKDSMSGQFINDTHTISTDFNGSVLVRAVSNSGIKGSTASVPVKRDAAIPNFTVDVSGTVGQWTANPVSFTLTGTGGNLSPVTYYVKIGSSDWTALSGNSVTFSDSMDATCQFKAVSAAGIEAASGGYAVMVDAGLPTLSVTGNPINWTNQDVTLHVDAECPPYGVQSVTVSKDGGAAADITGQNTYVATENGSYVFTATNRAGNHVSTTVDVAKIDRASPTGMTVKVHTNSFTGFLHTITFGLFFSSTTDITLTAHDALSGINYYEYQLVDTSKGQSYNADGTWAQSDSGTFSIDPQFKGVIYARAVDKAGNVTASSEIVQTDGFAVDNQSPTAPAAAATVNGDAYNNGWTSGDVKIVASGATALSGIQYYEFKIGDSSTWTKMPDLSGATDSTSGNTVADTLSIASDINSDIHFRAVSNSGIAGNESIITVKRDSVVPSIHIEVSGTTGQWTENPVSFTLSNTANNISPVVYWVKIGSGDWTQISGNIYQVTGNVDTTYQFKAISGSGLTSSASDTYTVKLASNTLDDVINKIDNLPDPGSASDKDITDNAQAIKDAKILYDTLSKDEQSGVGQNRIDKLNRLIGRLNALLVIIPKDSSTGITAGNIGTSVQVPELNDPNISKVVVKLVVNPVSGTTLPANVSTANFALGYSGKSIAAAYDVSLLKTVFDTSGTQLNSGKVSNSEIEGPVTIRIPVPTEYIGQTGLQVVYINDAGAITPMPTTLITVDGIEYLQFTTTHFSLYAITVPNKASSIPNPKTGEANENLLWYIWPLGASGLILTEGLMTRRRKKNVARQK